MKKRANKNVHLQPIENYNPKRNTSVPPSGPGNAPAAPHPLNFAPSPHNVRQSNRAGAGVRL